MRWLLAMALLALAIPAYCEKIGAPLQDVKKAGDKKKTRDQTEEGRVHVKEAGFSIVPPKGWEKGKVGGTFFMAYMGSVADSAPNMRISLEEYDGTPLDKFAALVKEQFTKTFKEWESIDEGKLMIDGRQAYFLCGLATIQGEGKNKVQVKLLQYYIVGANNKKLYALTYGAIPAVFDRDKKMYEQSGLSSRLEAPQDAKQAGEMKKVQDHTGQGRVYLKEAGFSIVPPKGWEKGKGEGNTILVYKGPVADSTPNLNIRALNYDGTPLDKITAAVKEGMPKALKDWKLIDEDKVMIHGREAYRLCSVFTVEVKDQKLQVKNLQYFILGANKKYYVLTFTAIPTVFDQNRKMFEESGMSSKTD